MYEWFWIKWHITLRRWYGNEGYYTKSRPWYHLCCNGDAGGWRTNLCNYLEDKIRRKHNEKNFN